MAWAYLEGKTAAHYRRVFRILKKKIRDLGYEGLDWNPAEIVSDYERGIITAVHSEFPDSKHMGCYFHFTQRIWKKIKKIGLADAYKEDARFRKFAR